MSGGTQPGQAIGTFQEVLRQNPDVAQAHYNLALLYYAQGDYQLASQQFFALKGLDLNMAAELFRLPLQGSDTHLCYPPGQNPRNVSGQSIVNRGNRIAGIYRVLKLTRPNLPWPRRLRLGAFFGASRWAQGLCGANPDKKLLS